MGNESVIPPHYLNAVVTGDARVLAEALPDNSVDLIFTDPVYSNLKDYEWLAFIANRLLRNDGALLCFCSIELQYETQQALMRNDRKTTWIMPVVYSAGNTPRFHRLGFAKWSMLLWVGGQPLNHFCDAQISMFEKHINPHVWTKNVKPIAAYITAFSNVGAVVFDPFSGGGTVPTVCKMLGRQYIAFEIDPTTADNARQRILNTQPPLPLVYDNQLAFNLDT